MIKINKNEAEKLREQFPELYIAVVNRQKNGAAKTRYVEESPQVMGYIKKLRRGASRRSK